MAVNATVIPGVAPPSGFLFRPANPAAFPPLRGFIGVALSGRDSIGSTCSSTEAKCAQGDWCCDIGDTCSVLDGAFLCCPPGAAGAGCARVCATGDFQCGSICCANTQTCGGGDTPFPFCINPTATSTASTAATTSVSSAASTASSIIPTPSLSSTIRPASTTPPPVPTPTETTPNATQPPPTRAPSSESGLPLTAQITMGVLVPVLVILLVVGLWFCLFRRPAQRRREFHDGGESRPSTPPPAYSKNETIVSTASQGYSFSRARSPGGSLRAGSSHEMDALRRPGLAISTQGATRASVRSQGSVSPTSTYHPGVSRLDI